MITEHIVSILDKIGDHLFLTMRRALLMSPCSSFRKISEDQYEAQQLKTLLQLRFQMSKVMLDFKKANSSIFKLLTLKITKIYALLFYNYNR